MRTSTYSDSAGRVCTGCKEYKLWENFYSNQTERGFNSKCRPCAIDHARGYYTKTTDKNLRGSGYINSNGYAVLPDRRLKHRVIIEIMLGRELKPWEEVHHKNGIRSDNHYDNLELWCVPQPYGQRVEDLVKWVCEAYPELVEERRCGQITGTNTPQ